MSKRSNFERVEKDFYPTWDTACLVPEFTRRVTGKSYYEPCCGEGDLVKLLEPYAKCVGASDVEDRGYGIAGVDAKLLVEAPMFITNPPYKRDMLLPLIDHLVSVAPTWLLLPSDLMHNIYFGDYMKRCSLVISIGRMCWIKGTKTKSTDNYCWYHWYHHAGYTKTEFIGR